MQNERPEEREAGAIWDRLNRIVIALLAAKTAHTADSAKAVPRTAFWDSL
jgi:hypothetical protein